MEGYKCVCDAAKEGDWWKPGWILPRPECSYCKPVTTTPDKIRRDPNE